MGAGSVRQWSLAPSRAVELTRASRPGGRSAPDRHPVKPSEKQRPSATPRDIAVRIVRLVLEDKRTLDDALEIALGSPHVTGSEATRAAAIASRDRAFARLIATTVLRRHGQLTACLNAFLDKGIPKNSGRLSAILECAAAQLLFLNTPPHAAISQAVDQVKSDRRIIRYRGLANAVLRRLSAEGHEWLKQSDPVRSNIPSWLLAEWEETYGRKAAQSIALASLEPATFDITPNKSLDVESFLPNTEAIRLSTGSLRLKEPGPVGRLPGYAEGKWWVQDAAAAVVAPLLGDVNGRQVADLCTAPGGKAAQLAARGANVVAVDVSPRRLNRLSENLRRLGLSDRVATVAADITAWEPGEAFDAVLLDAPCTATGTLRRHPDILHLRTPDDVAKMAALQARLLRAASGFVRPGGILVYATCSLQAQEGPDQIGAFFESSPGWTLDPLNPEADNLDPGWIDPHGCLRTRPDFLQHADPALSGMDGFFAARLRKSS